MKRLPIAALTAASILISPARMTGAEAPAPATVATLPGTVVTATRNPVVAEKSPVRTEVIEPAEMERRNTLTLSQAVELVNGVRVEPICQNHGSSEVQMLGLGGAYSQILFDGIPILSPLGADCGIDRIATVFGDRVEIVKGGGSALYGPNAVAGVINIVSVEPIRSGGFVGTGVEVQKGVPLWHGEARGDAVLADRSVAVSLFGQVASNDAVDFNGDGYSESAERTFGTVGGRVWWTPDEDTKLRAEYQYTQENRRGGDAFDRPVHAANIAEWNETHFHRLAFNLDRKLDSNLDLGLGYSMAYIDRDSYYGGLGDPSEPGYDPVAAAADARNLYGRTTNPTHFVDSRLNWRAGEHLVTLGVQHKEEAVTDRNLDVDGVELARLTDRSYRDTGLILQDEWSPAENVEVLPGVRVDFHSELSDPVVSPRLAVGYRPTPTLKLRPGVSTGFRAPEVFAEDLHVDTLGNTPVRVVNTPGLDAERSVTAMFGVEWASSEKDPLVTLDATTSYTRINDTFLLTRETVAPGVDIDRRSNSGGSSVVGGETNLTLRPDRRFKFTVGAAYYESRYDEEQSVFDDGAGTVLVTRDYLKTPKWTGVAQATFMPTDELSFFAALKYTGPMDVLNNRTASITEGTRDFYVVDLGLTYKWTLTDTRSLDFTAGVKNVPDDRQRDLESGPGRDSDYFYGPRAARTFYASVKCRF